MMMKKSFESFGESAKARRSGAPVNPAAAPAPSSFKNVRRLVLIVGLAAYGALFAFVGASLKRPLIVGLVFAFGWEQTVLLIPGYLKRLSVAYYLQALVPHAMPQDSSISALLQVFQEFPPVWVSLVSLTGITVLGLWLAG